MKQPNTKKLKWIAILMIATQLLLLLFLVKWLDYQYREEKTTLHEKLEDTYKEAYENVLENNIAQKMDSLTWSIGDSSSPDIHHTFFKHSTVTVTKDSNGTKRINIKQGDSVGNRLKKGLAVMVKSVLIEAKKSGDTVTLVAPQDSNLVMRSFKDKLQDKNIRVAVSWTTSKNDMQIELNQPEPWRLMFIADYNPFLIKKITPQIGFSLLLFLLCGAAFILSYTTIKKQHILNLQKDDFINNMSHELKTPVATTKVAIEALQKFDGMEDMQKRRDYLDMAAWEMDRLDRLVANVMNNVQMQNGTINMLKQPMDVNTLLEQLVHNMQPLFGEKNKILLYQSNVKNALLNADAVHIQGTVYNILDNAIKYGGDNVTVNVKQEANNIRISISDNGQGIPEAYKQKVFEKFFRIPSGNVHNVNGYGLGLNYAHYVVIAHGGNITQENNKEGGATFIISLPMQS